MNFFGWISCVRTRDVVKKEYAWWQFTAPSILDRMSSVGEFFKIHVICNCQSTLYIFNQDDAPSVPKNDTLPYSTRVYFFHRLCNVGKQVILMISIVVKNHSSTAFSLLNLNSVAKLWLRSLFQVATANWYKPKTVETSELYYQLYYLITTWKINVKKGFREINEKKWVVTKA